MEPRGCNATYGRAEHTRTFNTWKPFGEGRKLGGNAWQNTTRWEIGDAASLALFYPPRRFYWLFCLFSVAFPSSFGPSLSARLALLAYVCHLYWFVWPFLCGFPSSLGPSVLPLLAPLAPVCWL